MILATTSAWTFTSSCILPKFGVHAANDLFSDKFDNGWKNQNDQFIAIFCILRQ